MVEEKQPYFSTFELILLALFGALIVGAKLILRFPIKAPGHSHLFWLALIIVARGIVPKPGSAVVVGLISGILAGFIGTGDYGALYTIISYTTLGLVTDCIAWLLGGVETWWGAVVAAAAGSAIKMLVKAVMASALGIPAGFVAFGMLWAFISNVGFGSAGGFLGWLILRALRQAGFFGYLAEKK